MNLNNLISIEYVLDNWKPQILVLTRDENKEKNVLEINNFFPYIYIEEKDKEKLLELFSKDVVDIQEQSKKYIHDSNLKLLKATLKNPFCAYNIKNSMKTYESDIVFSNRWCIDNVEKIESKNLRINYLDIETTSVQGFPNYLNPVENIISLGCNDSYLEKSFLWIWHTKYSEEIIQQDVEEGKLEVRRFSNETDMLNDYLDFMVKTKPDFVTSWAVSFDVPYLVARLDKLDLEASKLSPFYKTDYENKFYKGLIEWKNGPDVYGKRFGITEGQKHVEIKGLHYFDMLTAYKNIIAKELESFKLDFVAHKELGINKLKTHFDIGSKWLEDPEFIEKYNYVDVFLIKELDKKMKILNRYITIRDKSFLPDINAVFSTGKVLDNYILKAYKDKFIFPSKVYDENIETRIAGGFVRDPIPNLYKNIAVFDFSGFYPSLMRTFNLSSEKLINEEIITFDPTITEEVGVQEILENKMYDWDEDKKEIIYKIRTNKFNADLKYKLDEKGVLTTAVADLISLRKKAKDEMKKYEYGSVDYKQAYNNQFSFKFLINSVDKDTWVIIRDKISKEIDFVKIYKLEKDYKKYETLVNVPNTNKFEWKDIIDFVKEKVADKKIFEVKAKYGIKIGVSSNHSLYVLENNIEVMKKGCELKTGDKIINVRWNNKINKECINLYDDLKNKSEISFLFKQKLKLTYPRNINMLQKLLAGGKLETGYERRKIIDFLIQEDVVIAETFIKNNRTNNRFILKDKLYLKELLCLLKSKKKTTFFIKNEYYLDVTSSLKENKITHLKILQNIFCKLYKTKKYRKFWPLLLPIDESLLSILGFYISEGSIHGDNTLCLSQKDNRYKKNYETFCKKYNIVIRKKQNINQYLSDKIFFILVTKWCGVGSLNKQMPGWFIELSDEQYNILLHNMLIGDGHFRKKEKIWQYNSISKKLIQQISFRSGTTGLCEEKLSSDNIMFHIKISKEDNLKNYLEITSIEEQKYEDYLYDLTVKDYYDFYGGKSGFLRLRDSVYGACAYPGFRLYKLHNANAITAFARMLSKWVQYRLEEKGWKVESGDSVSFDSPVIVKDKNNNVHILPISEIAIFHNNIRASSQFKEILTRNGFKKINYVKRHKINKRMFRVWSNAGSVDATEDHSFFDKDKKEISPKDLKENQILEVRNFEKNNKKIKKISLAEAWCLGLYLAEGSWLGKYQFVVNGNKKTLNTFIKKWGKHNCSNILSLTEKNGCDRIGWLKKREILKKCYDNNKKKIIPYFILNASKEIQKEFLKGFYEGDGEQKSLYPRIDQKSKVLSMSLCYLYYQAYGKIANILPAGPNKENFGMRFVNKMNTERGKIKSIKRIKYNDYVYDVSTEDGTFVTGIMPIVVHNTDSLFTQLKTNELKDNLQEIEKEIEPLIKNAINEFTLKYLPKEFAEQHVLKMDCEKIYSSLLLMDVKKRYIGLLKYFEGKEVNEIHYMGLDLKKSNTIEVCKRAQFEVAEAILKEQDTEKIIKRFYDEVKEAKDFNSFKIPSKLEKPIEAYVYKKGDKEGVALNRPTIRAVNWSNQNLGTKFRAGNKFYILYIEDFNGTNVIAFENIEQLKNLKIKIDKKKFLKDLHSKIDNLIGGLHYYKHLNDIHHVRAIASLTCNTLDKWW